MESRDPIEPKNDPSLILQTDKTTIIPKCFDPSLKEKYRACMILAAVGDAMGFKNSSWEFQQSGLFIHKELMKITNNKGVKALTIDLSWKYSDDTVMHIATGKALSSLQKSSSIEEFGRTLAIEYKNCWSRMSGRNPGKTTGKSIQILEKDGKNWNKIPFRERSMGCGASMRTACIGLLFPKNSEKEKLIAVAIEAGRLTHHHPNAYLGGLAAALFTSLALQKVDVFIWGVVLLETIPLAKKYIEEAKREVKQNLANFQGFTTAWEDYLKLRKLSLTSSEEAKKPVFPEKYGVLEREHFIKSVAINGWGGSCGHDSVIIAYDALIGCQGSWEEFCLRGVLHGGDNDSTGSIGGAWFGALYGLEGVPKNNYERVEDINLLKKIADNIYEIGQK